MTNYYIVLDEQRQTQTPVIVPENTEYQSTAKMTLQQEQVDTLKEEDNMTVIPLEEAENQ